MILIGIGISPELKLSFTTTMPISTHPKISGSGASATQHNVGLRADVGVKADSRRKA
jgi:hypothetical protein